MERDDEWNGTGNAYDFGARIYDSRLGRWLARDPLEAKFVRLSTYSFGLNNPILFVDFDGRDIILGNKNSKKNWGSTTLKVLGTSDVFLIDKNNRVQVNKKAFRKMKKSWDADQMAIAEGLAEIVNNEKKRLYVYSFKTKSEQQSNRDISGEIVFPKTYSSSGKILPEFSPSHFELNEADGAGAKTYTYSKETGILNDMQGIENIGLIVVNEEELASISLTAVPETFTVDGVFDFEFLTSEGAPNAVNGSYTADGLTTPADLESTIIHEILDHGLRWNRNRIQNPKLDDRSKEVKYHNMAKRAINKITGTLMKMRSGKDH